jgi:dipeptide/tripeptide permease
LQYINYYAAAMAFVAFLWVVLLYRNIDRPGPTKTVTDVLRGFGRVLTNFRFMALIIVVAGFWIIQSQLYAAMPKYILRLVGEHAKPEWIANVNPFVVVVFVVPVTHLIRKLAAENAIGIALLLISVSATITGTSTWIESNLGKTVSLFGVLTLHSVTLTVVVGIALQGFAECFLSPKFYEFASRQAPPGEEGLYMGYQNLPNFIAYLVGFALSGHLLDRFCPDPAKLPPEIHAQWQAALETGSAMPEAYAHAHYIWFVYAAIGLAALLALCVFRLVTNRLDRKRVAT